MALSLSPCVSPFLPCHSCPVTESLVVSHLRPITTKNLPSPFPLSTLEAGSTPLFSWLLGICGDTLPQVAPPEFRFFFFFQGSLKWGAECELWEFEGSFPPFKICLLSGEWYQPAGCGATEVGVGDVWRRHALPSCCVVLTRLHLLSSCSVLSTVHSDSQKTE